MSQNARKHVMESFKFQNFPGENAPRVRGGGRGEGDVAPQRASYSVQIRHLLHFLMTILEHDTLMQHKYCWNICPFLYEN